MSGVSRRTSVARRLFRGRGLGRARAGGFTLIEVLLASATAAVLGAALWAMVIGYAHTLQRIETQRRLALLRDAFGAFYRANTFLVESSDGPELRTGEQSRIASGSVLQAADIAPLQAYLARGAGPDAYRDGYGQPVQVFVSTRRIQLVDGVGVACRRMAFVSAGRNQRFETGDWNPDVAVLERGGDDEVAVFDAWADQAELFRRTDLRMQRFAEAVRAYAQGRYLLDPNRDPLIDYFGRADDASGTDRFDPGSALLRGAGRSGAGLSDAELAALQLSRDDVTSAWGQPIRYENDTDQVRHPDRPAPDNFPPYTARVVAQLPGRAEYQHLVIGAF